jgi:hypothetical protein
MNSKEKLEKLKKDSSKLTKRILRGLLYLSVMTLTCAILFESFFLLSIACISIITLINNDNTKQKNTHLKIGKIYWKNPGRIISMFGTKITPIDSAEELNNTTGLILISGITADLKSKQKSYRKFETITRFKGDFLGEKITLEFIQNGAGFKNQLDCEENLEIDFQKELCMEGTLENKKITITKIQ